MSGLDACASYVSGANSCHIVTEANEEELRNSCTSGDVAIVVGDFPGRDRILRRLEAWKVGRIWLGSGPTPPVGLVDAAWIDAPTNAVTQIFEAAATQPPKKIFDDLPENSCITCRDEGIVGEVLKALGPTSALVRFGDFNEEVDTTMVGELGPMELVLVHAGVAISTLEG